MRYLDYTGIAEGALLHGLYNSARRVFVMYPEYDKGAAYTVAQAQADFDACAASTIGRSPCGDHPRICHLHGRIIQCDFDQVHKLLFLHHDGYAFTVARLVIERLRGQQQSVANP